jgi:regulatory protein
MKVSGIKQQVKTQGRYSIFIDGKFSFGLSESALMKSGLRIGKEISREELVSLKDVAKADKAFNRALGLIARRPRSEWEIRDYLRRKEYDPEFIDELVDRLRTGKWLDDNAFARMWVENRRLLKATSSRRLTQELKQKRVSDDIIKDVLFDDQTDEIVLIKEIITRKRKQTRYQDNQKLIAYLVRQGYNYSDVKDALKEIDQ